jgi:hypothetical protein
VTRHRSLAYIAGLTHIAAFVAMPNAVGEAAVLHYDPDVRNEMDVLLDETRFWSAG